MSWEVEKGLDTPRTPRRPGSPLVIVGFVVGVIAVSPFAYYWLLAWLIPLVVAGVFVVLAAVAGRRAWWFLHLAEGAAAATVFSLLFLLIGFFGTMAFGA